MMCVHLKREYQLLFEVSGVTNGEIESLKNLMQRSQSREASF